MTRSDDEYDEDPLDDPRFQAGVEHLQRAAHELIAASRALLDVAEEVVEDPRSLGGLLGLLGEVGELAGRAAGRRPGTGHNTNGHQDSDDDDDDEGEPPVQRIPIS